MRNHKNHKSYGKSKVGFGLMGFGSQGQTSRAADPIFKY